MLTHEGHFRGMRKKWGQVLIPLRERGMGGSKYKNGTDVSTLTL